MKTVSHLLAVIAVLGLAVASTRWFDVAVPAVVALQSVSSYAGVAALVVALVALLMNHRSWVPRVAVTVLAIDLVASAMVMSSNSPVRVDARDSMSTLRVVSANVGPGIPDADAVAGKINALDADVVVLVEAGLEIVNRLSAAGLDPALVQRSIQNSGPRHDLSPGNLTVLSRVPVETATPPGTSMPSELMTVPGTGLTILGVHVSPPLGSLTPAWETDLAAIDAWSRRQDGRLMVVGDFNSTPAHPGFRALCAGDDGLLNCGGGFGTLSGTGTWTPFDSGPDLLRLDHHLSRGLTVVDSGTFDVAGGDHRGLWTEVVVPTS